MTAIVIRGGRSAKASRDLRWTTESRALGDASGFGQELPVAVTFHLNVVGSRLR